MVADIELVATTTELVGELPPHGEPPDGVAAQLDECVDVQAILAENQRLKFQLRARNSVLGNLRVKYARLNSRFEHVSDKLRAHTLAALENNPKRGVAQRYFTVKGGLELACRRVLSNCGAYAFGMATGLDMHGTTLGRYEVRATV